MSQRPAVLPADDHLGAVGVGEWRAFRAEPLRVQVHLAATVAAALSLPFALRGLDPRDPSVGLLLPATVLVLVSVLNVELGRRLSRGLSRTQQPHMALSAWAFAAALLLPTPWLLVVVPLTYAHARWRGIRVPLAKWIGSGAFLVLAALAAAVVRHLTMGQTTNWMDGNGGQGILAMLLAAAAFLTVESLLFAVTAWLGREEEEAWLRRTLRGRSFYVTEAGILLIGGLLSAVWTGGSWFTLLFVPIYWLAQRAVLHEPLRERAEAAAELSAHNRDLELANQFKIDLMGVLGHEIGNPLAAILLHAELGAEDLPDGDCDCAGDGMDAEAVRKTLTVIERNALQVMDVVHDLLVLVSSDRGALAAQPEPTPLRRHLTAAAESQPPDARPEVDCPPSVHALVQPGHLDQMLGNLLGNAVKYAGRATAIRARAVDAGRVEVTVSDCGPGVPEAFHGRLFERFSREADSARKVMGTGLGLYITRELARANGGDVVHRPARPRGSEFVIVLQQATAAE